MDWLVDAQTGNLLEALRKTQSVTLNETFTPPAPPKLIDWRTLSFPEYLRERDSAPDQPLAEFARKRLWGIDAGFAQAIGEGAAPAHEDRGILRSRWDEFAKLMGQIRAAVNTDTPVCVSDSGRGKPVILPCATDATDARSFPSLALALARTDKEIAKEESQQTQVADVTAELNTRIAQLGRRLTAIEKAITDGDRADDVKHEGDLLGANRHLLRKGTREVTITDWESGEECHIKLDPALSAQENINGFYQRARKLARGAETARAQRSAIMSELQDAESTLQQLEAGELAAGDLTEALPSGGSSGTHPGGKQEPARRLPYREFTVGKYTILVGKSRRDNDDLTLHIARPYDLFFHADRVGGSHVILRQPEKGREFPPEVMATAAQAAAYFSKAKHSALVPVIYTEIRYVTKPRKAPAGLVRVTNEKSLMVEPAPPPGYHDGQPTE